MPCEQWPGLILWRSRSAVLTEFLETLIRVTPGVCFSAMATRGAAFQFESFCDLGGPARRACLFTAITDQAHIEQPLSISSVASGFVLGGVALVFVLAQFLALRWGLTPYCACKKKSLILERGQRDQLSDGYPDELQELAAHLQHFVTQEQNQRRRYRQALDNLAHSLKTPLSVISNALKERQPSSALLQDQVSRMQM